MSRLDFLSAYLVRKERLELSRVAPLEPKSSASTDSATLAKIGWVYTMWALATVSAIFTLKIALCTSPMLIMPTRIPPSVTGMRRNL
jgi:hypothetical protein